MARGSTPAAAASASTPTPYLPAVCTTICPARHTPSSARPEHSPASASSGIVSSTRSAALTTSSGVITGTPGRSVSMRLTDSAETPDAPTTECPASRRAAPKTAPTRPAPTTPTFRRDGSATGHLGAERAGPLRLLVQQLERVVELHVLCDGPHLTLRRVHREAREMPQSLERTLLHAKRLGARV